MCFAVHTISYQFQLYHVETLVFLFFVSLILLPHLPWYSCERKREHYRTDAMKFPHVILNCPSHLISQNSFSSLWIGFNSEINIQNECGECRRLLSFQWATSTQHFVYLCNVISSILLGIFFGCGFDYV